MLKRLYRSTTDKMVAGICGGLGDYFNVDSTLIRLAFVVLLFMSWFTFILVYLIAALIIPLDRR